MESTYTLAEVAESLKVSDETVAHWIRNGELTAFNVSRDRQSGKPRLRVRQSDLDAFLATRSTAPPPKTERRRPRSLPEVKEFI